MAKLHKLTIKLEPIIDANGKEDIEILACVVKSADSDPNMKTYYEKKLKIGSAERKLIKDKYDQLRAIIKFEDNI